MSLPAARAVRVLGQVNGWRGAPEAIRCDSGPELLSATSRSRCRESDVTIRSMRPGKPSHDALNR